MTRLMLIVSFCLLLFANGFGQNPDSSVLVKKFNLNLLLIKEKLVADSLVNAYGDSSNELYKILGDTTFIKSIIQPNSHAHDQLICSTYNIP